MARTLVSNRLMCHTFVERRNAPSLPRRVPFFGSTLSAPATLSALRASQREPPSTSSVDISVFRFTLGIPGFNDSDLPRALGIAFGAALILNHLFTANYIPPAQWRSEIIGLCNAILSINLPSIGQILNGRSPQGAATSMPKSRQIFCLSKNLLHEDKEELAWGSYALLKNTKTTSLVIWNEGLLCARGFWDVPSEGEGDVMNWLEKLLKESSLFMNNTYAYEPFKADKLGWNFIPAGVVCSLVVPSDFSPPEEARSVKKAFILLLSSTRNAFSRKDLQWIEWLSRKLLSARSSIHVKA